MTAAHQPEARGAGMAWGVIATGAAIYDIAALLARQETISNASRRLSERHPLLTMALGEYMVLHLTGKIPKQFDPLDIAWEHVLCLGHN